MSNVSLFTNDMFKLLAHLYDIRGADNVARITQYEAADDLDLCRQTANKFFTALKENGCIQADRSHIGRYIVTAKGIMIVNTIRKIDK